MTRSEFLEKLQKNTGLSDEKIKKLDKIMTEHTPVGKDDREKTVYSLKKELGMSDKDANNLYNEIAKIVSGETFDKVADAFKDFAKKIVS